jgi:predicted dienelactone hydrolase
MMGRAATVFAGLIASACCTSLPKQAPKRVAFPGAAVRFSEAGEAPVAEESHVWRDEKRNRDVPVKLYVPTGTGRHPVVVFSHGIGENRDSYAYLGQALARAGFLAVHVTHAGTDKAVLEHGYRALYRQVKQPQNWIARPLDVSFVLDQLAQRKDADMDRVAVAGHSAGAFTAFALAGMRTVNGGNFRDERVKVVVPISMPRMDHIVPEGGYASITIPVLNVTGTCDTSIIYRTFPRHRRIPFEQSRGQFLVTLKGVNHDNFVLDDPRHELIADLVIAFLRGYLLGDASARAWFEEPGNAELVGVNLAVERR